MSVIAGVDEVGRGTLAGPVVAAAVILPEGFSHVNLRDSKLISPAKRLDLVLCIREHAISFAFGQASVTEIDRLNIHQASLLAMQRALANLSHAPKEVLVDGRFTPTCAYPCRAIIGGDKMQPSISAAANLAKLFRDDLLTRMEDHYPGYGFARHKGYATRQHLDALARLGVSDYHRQSFAPVKRLCQSLRSF